MMPDLSDPMLLLCLVPPVDVLLMLVEGLLHTHVIQLKNKHSLDSKSKVTRTSIVTLALGQYMIQLRTHGLQGELRNSK